MTFSQMLESAQDFLTPEDVSGVLACRPYSINLQAKTDPARLGFPVCVVGTRVKIPRMAFIRWMQVGNAPVQFPVKEGA